jgi:hypothetical protein
VIKLKTRNVTLLTDDEVSLVSGGADTNRPLITDDSCFDCGFSIPCVPTVNYCPPTMECPETTGCPETDDCPSKISC